MENPAVIETIKQIIQEKATMKDTMDTQMDEAEEDNDVINT
jgi:hypothetical protein